MAHDVFISYSSKDKAVADAICANLESRKIRCWIAPRDILPGTEYADALMEGLNQGRVMVLVFSENSNESPQVLREVERAVHRGIPILPFRIENVLPSKAMEYFVSSSQWLDALTPPLEMHLQKLADTVRVLLSDVNTSSSDSVPSATTPTTTAVKPRNKDLRWFIAVGSVVVVIAVIGVILLVSKHEPPYPVIPQPTDNTSHIVPPLPDKTNHLDIPPVQTPKIVAGATIPPTRINFGQPFYMGVIVLNTGNGKAENVHLYCRASPSGLIAVESVDKENSALDSGGIQVNLGAMYPGEQRNVNFVLRAPTQQQIGGASGQNFGIDFTADYYGGQQLHVGSITLSVGQGIIMMTPSGFAR